MRALLARVGTKESLCFSVSGSSHKENVLSSGGQLSKLVKGKTLSLGSSNSVSGSCCEFQSNDSESFGDVEKSVVIGYGSNHGNNAFKLVVFELRVAIMTESFDDA